MYLTGYTRVEIFRPECNPSFTSLHCVATLPRDISEVLPYVNARLGGHEYLADPPALVLKVHGRLITLHPDRVAVNALKDEEEAERILEWVRREINEAYETRAETVPSFASAPKPDFARLLKHLPRTNCRRCGAPTCLVFAVRLAEGSFEPDDCPPLGEPARAASKIALAAYLAELHLPRAVF